MLAQRIARKDTEIINKQFYNLRQTEVEEEASMTMEDAGSNEKTEKSLPVMLQSLNLQNELDTSEGTMIVLNMDRDKVSVDKKKKKCC
jgi:hypothetical protein